MTPTWAANSLDFISHSAAQTQRFGEHLGRLLQPGDVICLEGDLGAGKTCLTQGIARGLGVSSVVASPTFIIINEYKLAGQAHKLCHVDLYRIESTAEARALGMEDCLYGDGVCVIEWAERIREILPAERMWITLCYVGETKRELRLDAQGEHYTKLLEQFRAEAFAAYATGN